MILFFYNFFTDVAEFPGRAIPHRVRGSQISTFVNGTIGDHSLVLMGGALGARWIKQSAVSK